MKNHEREDSPKWRRAHILFRWFCIEEIQNCQDLFVLESYLNVICTGIFMFRVQKAMRYLSHCFFYFTSILVTANGK